MKKTLIFTITLTLWALFVTCQPDPIGVMTPNSSTVVVSNMNLSSCIPAPVSKVERAAAIETVFSYRGEFIVEEIEWKIVEDSNTPPWGEGDSCDENGNVVFAPSGTYAADITLKTLGNRTFKGIKAGTWEAGEDVSSTIFYHLGATAVEQEDPEEGNITIKIHITFNPAPSITSSITQDIYPEASPDTVYDNTGNRPPPLSVAASIHGSNAVASERGEITFAYQWYRTAVRWIDTNGDCYNAGGLIPPKESNIPGIPILGANTATLNPQYWTWGNDAMNNTWYYYCEVKGMITTGTGNSAVTYTTAPVYSKAAKVQIKLSTGTELNLGEGSSDITTVFYLPSENCFVAGVGNKLKKFSLGADGNLAELSDIPDTAGRQYYGGAARPKGETGFMVTWKSGATTGARYFPTGTNISGGSFTSLKAVAYSSASGTNYFVGVGTNTGNSGNAGSGYVATGNYSWTEANLSAASGLPMSQAHSVAYGSGRFVVGGNNGGMAYSTALPPNAWTVVSPGFGTDTVSGLAYGGGYSVVDKNITYSFVAMTSGSQTVAARWSPESETAWNSHTTIPSFRLGDGDSQPKIAHGNKVFVAAGTNLYGDLYKAAWSADRGATWEVIELGSGGMLYAVAYGEFGDDPDGDEQPLQGEPFFVAAGSGGKVWVLR